MKKVLSIVLSVAMVVCLMPSLAFASATNGDGTVDGRQVFSDIEGERCEGAVNVLNAIGVVNGYPDGTFKPGNDVKRCEMAQMITKALGVEAYASATESIFTDMNEATWAIPQVEYCAQLGIVKGYGDGTFGPNDLVTYEQAATMIVRAIGYTDDCNEMISGVWPANYVQKALELGIFADTDNGGTKTANRGDVALMLYNGLDVPQVYIDNDGVTRQKSGDEAFVGTGGEVFYGTSMLASLNKDGDYEYKIVSYTDIDNAIYDIGDYFGTVAKVYTDKNGDVLAVGNIQTTLMTGTFNGDFDEFTCDGKKYTFSDRVVKQVAANNRSFKAEDGVAPVYGNGTLMSGLGFDEMTDLKNFFGLRDNQKITLAAKVSGSTITQVFSAHYWYVSPFSSWTKVVEESDLSPIFNKQTLFGRDFLLDYDGDPDTNTFELIGVETLADIGPDDVVTVYADGRFGASWTPSDLTNDGKIRRIEVGTERVEGTLDSFSSGVASDGFVSDGTTKKWGKPGQATIDGATYKTSYLTISDDNDDADMYDWVSQDDSDDVQVGDVVKVYLDYEGGIFQVEQSEASSSSYAMVMDYDLSYDNGKIVNGNGINGDNSGITVMTSNGSVVTLYFKNNADVVDDDGDYILIDNSISVGDIITYDLNSSNRIRKVHIKDFSSIDDSRVPAGYDYAEAYNKGKSDITKKGYWDGQSISENVTCFSIDEFSDRNDGGYENGYTYPKIWIDDDDAGVVNYSSLTDVDDVYSYAYYKKNSKIAAFVIDGDAVSSSKTFGYLTSWTKLSSDHSSGCAYQVTALIDGESVTYYYDADDPYFNLKKELLQFKFNASGNISDIYEPGDVDFEGELLGYAIAGHAVYTDGKTYNDSGITFRNGTAAGWTPGGLAPTSWSVDSDAYYYEWKGGSGNMANSSKTDIESADAGKYVLFFDVPNDDSDDPDGIVDIVAMVANGTDANSNGAGVDTTKYVTELTLDFTGDAAKTISILEQEDNWALSEDDVELTDIQITLYDTDNNEIHLGDGDVIPDNYIMVITCTVDAVGNKVSLKDLTADGISIVYANGTIVSGSDYIIIGSSSASQVQFSTANLVVNNI